MTEMDFKEQIDYVSFDYIPKINNDHASYENK